MQVQLHCGRTTVVGEGQSHVDVFRQLVDLQDLFGNSRCGKCGSDNTYYRIRKTEKDRKKFEYFEMSCRDCYAKLPYHMHDDDKKGSMYIQKRVPDEKKEPNTEYYEGGWEKYNKPQEDGGSKPASKPAAKSKPTASQRQAASDNVSGDDDIPF